ncbi:MAG: hypothetical protein COV34_02825 [Candidatus Zambryskibacteria bacterium CG10_big_fil_rev_8_21_14_0_10_42_12]|uniref:ABC transporter domain-containing protein n=1 Tax=Candidatus Zambryskibacteria bacterium CG10_big_fil_rev_8_21_14_0_10_42_12 TaxID=1975115 RepID=A0A2H0QVL7_9BACT|nr:MAG: hypothetical protein COV34_02825 [Candidatus Zambryskibacteria bacterium CG10_big_fil_rev_8_21_14_0_10_42_12]
MLLVRHLEKKYDYRTVLKDVSFSIERGQRAALVGPNGIGKTTLLRVLARLEEPTRGEIEFHPRVRVGFLAQETIARETETIKTYVDREAGYDVPVYQIETMLHGFQMEHVGVEYKINELSGGQKRKVALAAILLCNVELLLLDEPTNNLDIASVIWLEEYLTRKKVTAIIVSHDRAFLDNVADRILALDPVERTLTLTRGKYSNYLDQEKKREKREQLEYTLQQYEMERLLKRAAQKKEAAAKGAKWQPDDNDKMLRGFKQNRARKSARVAQVLEGRVDRMDKLAKPSEKTPLVIPLESEKEKGVADMLVNKVSFSYKDFKLTDVLLDIPYGTRVVLLGNNGAGKSTLLKIITGIIPPEKGSMERGSGVRIGNLMQEHDNLPKRSTPISFIKKHTVLSEHQVFNLLKKFGIDDVHTKGRISDLSSGQRVRLLLALFATQSVNVLVLDEPTNHLDIEGVEALEELLTTYEGTVVLVTHDRKLLEHAKAEQTYLMEKGKLSKIKIYTEYLEKSEKEAEKLVRMI